MIVERSQNGRLMAVGGKSLIEISKECGLHRAEVSMALGKRRLLNREKLKNIQEAGYPLEMFVFGIDWYEKNILGKKDVK